MECCISVCSSVVGNVGELMVQHIHGQFEFIFFYKKHLDSLKESISLLADTETRIKLSVEKARKNLQEIHDDVQHWLKKVYEVVEEAKRIVEQAEALGDVRCGHGLFPNFKLRHRLGKKAYTWELKVREMLNTAPNSESVSYRPERQCPIENHGYESFESRRKIFDDIKEALRNDDNNIIGVYGMAGIGKTMLVKEVARQALRENLFSEVIITTVSQKRDYGRIQQEIAEQLNFNFGDKTEISERGNLLQEKFGGKKEGVDKDDKGNVKDEVEVKQEPKKKLIVLDDIWEKFDLSIVGISLKSSQATCKVILTSRFEAVVRDDMDITKYFMVSIIFPTEAMDLFNKIVRSKAINPDFKDIAKDIVEECAQLPIVINTVASALKNKSVYEWRDALRQLQNSILTDIKEMDKKVFKSIQMSYDFLRSEEAQTLLLFCCLYEEDANIDVYHLLMHCLGWGLFTDVYKLEDAKCRIHMLVDKLKDHSLLLKGDHDWSIKLHDVVRDFGIHFARVNKQIYNIRSDEEMDKRLDEKQLENSIAISLQYDQIKCLPQRLQCPRLQLFWARKDRNLQLRDLFFKESRELKVLDLSLLTLQQPPSSLCYLDNLHTLRLSGCNLGSVSRIGELKNLKVLDFSRSNIQNLPEEIGQLTRLQLLDMHECYRLKKIHPGVLSKLTRLEELNMKDTFIQWEAQQDKGERKNNASLGELMGLHQLSALHLNISSAHIAPKNLFNGKVLERYDISVNYPTVFWFNDKWKKHALFTTKRLRLNLEGSCFLDYDLGMLLESCEEVQLQGRLEGVNSLLPGTNAKGFPQLKHLKCKRAEIQYIINSVQQSHHLDCGAFKLLETLNLVSLERLERVCHGNLAPNSFSNLMDLKVDRCHKLRNLFSFSMAKHLSQLQIIEVRDCKIIKEVVVHDGECSNNTLTTIFPKLHTVRLEALPVLLTFCSFEVMLSQRALALFNGQHLAPSLRELQIQDCGSVKYLLSSSLAAILSQLNRLEIRRCSMMEEIIMMDHEKMGTLQFPLLEYLVLDDLPKLIKFFSGTSLQFLALNVLQLSKCSELVTFVSNSLSTNISEPSEGDIYSNKVSLFADELVAPNLTELKVEECGSLKSLCSSFFAVKLVQMNRLVIRECCRMEEIIISMDEKITKIKFGQLKYLTLESLPKLRRFCSGIPVQFPHGSNLITGTSNISMMSKDSITGSSFLNLFNDNVSFPSLELISIGRIEKLNAIWHNQQAADSFCRLKEVYLISMSNVIMKNLLVRRPRNLRRLLTYKCDITEKVSLHCSDVEESSSNSDTTLQNSQLQLIVWKCGLKLPLSLSTVALWKNVTFLWIHSCHEPENLLTFGAAKGLPQLKAMIIWKCKNMMQVIANEGGKNITKGSDREIVFKHLEFLVLQDLPKLTSFCSGSDILRFPKLTHLGLKGCSRMMRFSNQVTDAPQLKKVTLKYGDTELNDKFIELLKPDDFNSLELFWSEENLDKLHVQDLSDNEVSIVIDENINNTIQHLWEVQIGIALRQLFDEEEHLNMSSFNGQYMEILKGKEEIRRKGILKRAIPEHVGGQRRF